MQSVRYVNYRPVEEAWAAGLIGFDSAKRASACHSSKAGMLTDVTIGNNASRQRESQSVLEANHANLCSVDMARLRSISG